jgi:hypothetical protein
VVVSASYRSDICTVLLRPAATELEANQGSPPSPDDEDGDGDRRIDGTAGD